VTRESGTVSATESENASRRCLVIGLMGGVGSGKSTVAQLLAERGARVFDADAICSELQETEQIREALREQWGDDVFTSSGELDRQKLAGIVFSEPAELERLGDIMHPPIIKAIRRQLDRCRTEDGPDLCVIDAPLLMESGLTRLCDVTFFIECAARTREERLTRSRGWAPGEAARREAQQAPAERKRDASDFIVDNSGDLAATRRQIEHCLSQVQLSGA
jgi:dephospho-CoA kinase